MISAHGNKTLLIVAAFMCISVLALVSSSILAQRKAKIRFYEKKYETVASALEENNQKEKQ